MKILVVDDQADARLIQKKILEQKKHDVIEAENGKQALSSIKMSPPDLIISDIMMPVMDGFELCKNVKAIPELANIPFIFYSAHFVEQHDIQLGENLEAARFLVKPLPVKQFIAEIDQVIADTNWGKKSPTIKTPLSNEAFGAEHSERLLSTLQKNIKKIEQSERLFKHLIESVPEAIYEATLPDLKFSFFGPKVQQLIGIDYVQFNNGTLNWYDQIHQEDKQRVLDQISLMLNDLKRLPELTPKPTFQLEYQVHHADDNKVIWVEDNGNIEFDENGKNLQIYGALTNINARKETEKQLLESFESTITSVSLALEKRDPYTAGHQHNCARIARAIAQQMNLDGEKIKGLYQAACIHDIGKIYLPSEILNKPSQLSDAEFGLIKTHVKVGYDIVKDVKFPWPISKIILQHHERLDGSGYPEGCRADDICIEAKILAVADVVDAMSSDRPYRKGFGIEAALTELEQNRGVTYDTGVVNACLFLFREKKFSVTDE